MRIMCDIALVLDVLAERPPFAEEAGVILDLCEKKRVDGYIPAASVPDIYYLIAESTKSYGSARGALSKLLTIVKVCSLTNSDVLSALALGSDDLDACLTAACAQSIGCDCIVSLQKTRYEGLGVPVKTPAELLAQLG